MYASEDNEKMGLFLLNLESFPKQGIVGAPTLSLHLTVDTVSDQAHGMAVVTQALEQPIVCRSSVSGNVIYETVMSPGESKIRIDLTGYPEIHWPSHGGIGPVMPKNFKAMVLLDSDWKNGTVVYQYLTYAGWQSVSQGIAIVENKVLVSNN